LPNPAGIGFPEDFMPNAPHAFKDRDVKRVIRASRAAGVEIDAIEVDPRTGKIRIISKGAVATSEQTALDIWKAKKQHARHAQGRKQQDQEAR
jgi:hypothetical protein